PTPLVLLTRFQNSAAASYGTGSAGFSAAPLPRNHRAPSVSNNAGATDKAATIDKRVADSQQAAKLTLALKKAPLPLSSWRARVRQQGEHNHSTLTQNTAAQNTAAQNTAAQNTVVLNIGAQNTGTQETAQRQEPVDAARYTDAQWAVELAMLRDIGPR